MKCSKCQFDNPDATNFCGKCGMPLTPDARMADSLTKTLETPVHILKAGSLIAGKYSILEEIGRGGMGVVYKAEDLKLKRRVALKFLPPHLMDSPELKERFLIEAQTAASLSHPNICVIHEVGDSEDRPYIAMEYVEGETAAVQKRLETIWSEVRPDIPFSHRFLDDALAWEYRRDRNWSRVVWWAGGFSLFIACLGLFGLTAISAVRRTKETGIRKVMGAGTADILFLFSRDILRWVVVAAFLSWPIAYIAARKWLEPFAYRVGLDIWMFAAAAVLALLVAGLTMSWHALRAARAEPARSLRYE